MLVSEIRGWQWAITWDNPLPADSSKMLLALGKLGRVTKADTKTTVMLAPRKDVDWKRIRKVIVAHLHPAKGNAVYVNMRSKAAFQYSKTTGYVWRRLA